jgi:hypothetical protein
LAIIIQYAFPDMGMDVALTQIGKKMFYAPMWLWCELQPDYDGHQGGGIRRLIDDYGLKRYWAHPCEQQAIDSLERQARAMWLFFSRPSSRRQRRILTQVERQTLTLERACTIKFPHLKGVLRLKWIADELDKIAGYAHDTYTPRRVQEILETAAEALLAAEEEAQTRKLRQQVREWQAVIEAAAVAEVDAGELAVAA